MDKIGKTRMEFIEMMGRYFQNEGASRISGRIFGLLLFDNEVYSFSDIARELGVSRGSVSTNTRHLVQMGAIVKTSKPSERQDYFVIHDAPFQNIMEETIRRTKQASIDISKLADELPSDSAPKERLSRLSADFENTAEMLSEHTARVKKD